MERSRLRHPRVAANAAGKFAQPCVELVDVALAPLRDLTVRADAHLIKHAFDDRTDADDQFQVVGRARRVEKRRRCVVLDVDDDLSIARGFGARIGEFAEQHAPILGERLQLWQRFE